MQGTRCAETMSREMESRECAREGEAWIEVVVLRDGFVKWVKSRNLAYLQRSPKVRSQSASIFTKHDFALDLGETL